MPATKKTVDPAQKHIKRLKAKMPEWLAERATICIEGTSREVLSCKIAVIKTRRKIFKAFFDGEINAERLQAENFALDQFIAKHGGHFDANE